MGKFKTQIKIGGNAKTRSQEKGKNKPIVMTSRPANTCAEDCVFRGLGIDHKPSEGGTSCYPVNKPGGGKNMFENAEDKGTYDTAKAFEELADFTPRKASVRHLEAGDIKTPEEGDDYIEQANKFHAEMPETKGWGYTHNDANLDPKSVQGWVLRSSNESRAQAQDAMDRGWAPVIESPSNDMLSSRGERIGGKLVRQCPAQTHPETVGCANCSMCRNENTVVEFEIHGQSKRINESRIRDVRHAEQRQAVFLGNSIPVGAPKNDDWATGQNRVTQSSSPDGDSTDKDSGTFLGMPSVPNRNSKFITGFSERNI